MANEISISALLSISRSGATLAGTGNLSITQSGIPSSSNVQAIGTTSEALDLGDITALGYLFLKNLDATNYVEISLQSTVTSADAFVTLLPGEFALIPTRLEAIYAKANTAGINLLVVAGSL